MDYKETLDFLFSRLPMFQRIGPAAFKKDLTNTLALCEALDNPHRKFPSVHIAGTNGKGSVSHLLAGILQAHGLKVGLYTSPHYRDFRERIKINGEFISKKYVTEFVERYRTVFDKIEPSFFEWTVALAFDYFAHKKVDMAIIEVGLGGRLDSTNVITPLVSVITNISFDHTQFLGDTLEKIAAEKAGIIKKQVPVVIGEEQAETKPVFEALAREQEAPIYFAERRLTTTPVQVLADHTIFNVHKIFDSGATGPVLYPALKVNLTGVYQKHNLNTALVAVEVLKERLDKWKFSEEKLRYALENLRSLTRFMGRWQKLGEKPAIICDSAHNEAGLSLAMEQVKQLDYSQLHIVAGFVNDKDIQKMLALMPLTAKYYFAKPDIPRGLGAEALREQAAAIGLMGKKYSSVKNALKAAKRNAGKDDLIYVGGSTFVVAEVI